MSVCVLVCVCDDNDDDDNADAAGVGQMEMDKVTDIYPMMRTESLPADPFSSGPLTPPAPLLTRPQILSAMGGYYYVKV